MNPFHEILVFHHFSWISQSIEECIVNLSSESKQEEKKRLIFFVYK